MLLTLSGLVLSFAAGMGLQRHPARERLVRVLWWVSFCVLGPVTAFYAFSVLTLAPGTAMLMAVVVATCWSALAVGYLFGALAGRDLRERAALALPIAFWNTGYVGYVCARLLWGLHGFTLMVFFDQIGFLVPAVVISTAIARSHSRTGSIAARDFLRALVVNPPLAGVVAAVALRLTGHHLALVTLGKALAASVGPFGFLVLGLAVPLTGAVLAVGELPRALSALAVRYSIGPLLLLLWGSLLHVHVPGVFFLAALTPAAAHLLVLSRIFSLRPAQMRLLVLGSTALTLAGVASAAALGA